MQGLVEFLRTLGAARLGAMAAVTIALIGLFAFIILRVTTPQLTTLFTDLTLEDSAGIIKELERQGIVYELKNDGAIVLVPRDQVARVRIRLAEGGLPKGGGVGYDIFDKTEALGSTSFVQNINHLRALEGELARTIRAIDRIQSARVHLVLPERPLFSRDKVEPSASIMLKVRGALEAQQVRAIRHLVASAVNGLKPERVSIVDETGRLLADGAAGDPASDLSAAADDRRGALERRLRDQIEATISPVVGAGRARVQVSAEMDYNRITETSDRFDPEGRVIRSSQSHDETSLTADPQGQVTVGNELPGAPRSAESSAREQTKKSDETINYEISRTTRTEVVEGGRIKRISVAVLVDGTYTRTGSDVGYQPRSQEEIERIAALVRSAIGFDQRRGDQVEVINLRFAEAPTVAITEPTSWLSYLQFTKDDVMRSVELAVMALLATIVILVVVRPLVRRIVTVETRLPAAPAGAALGGPASDEAVAAAIAEGAPAISSHTSKMIDIAQVQGQVHAQSIQKVGELAEKNPNETVAIIRQWLHETP